MIDITFLKSRRKGRRQIFLLVWRIALTIALVSLLVLASRRHPVFDCVRQFDMRSFDLDAQIAQRAKAQDPHHSGYALIDFDEPETPQKKEVSCRGCHTISVGEWTTQTYPKGARLWGWVEDCQR